MAPAATPATAMAAGSMPSTLMPWLAASDMPKKPAPAASMMAGVAAAAATQPKSAVSEGGRQHNTILVNLGLRLRLEGSALKHTGNPPSSPPLTLEDKLAEQHEQDGAPAGGDRHIGQHRLQEGGGEEDCSAGAAAAESMQPGSPQCT